MKYSIGRPRPVWEDLQQESQRKGLDDNVESWLSFPSVHASVSFALLFLLTLHLYMVHSHVTRKYNKLNSPNYDPWDSNNPYSHYFHWLFYKLRYVSAHFLMPQAQSIVLLYTDLCHWYLYWLLVFQHILLHTFHARELWIFNIFIQMF